MRWFRKHPVFGLLLYLIAVGLAIKYIQPLFAGAASLEMLLFQIMLYIVLLAGLMWMVGLLLASRNINWSGVILRALFHYGHRIESTHDGRLEKNENAMKTEDGDDGRQEHASSRGRITYLDGMYSTCMCAHHPYRYAILDCASCGKHMCAECNNKINNNYYCPDCAAKLKDAG